MPDFVTSTFFPVGWTGCLLRLQGPDSLRSRNFYFDTYADDLVAAHCAGTEVLAVAAANEAGMSRWLALDIDNRNRPDTSTQNLRLARSVYDSYPGDKLLEESSPNGSYHVWLFLAEPIPATEAVARVKQLAGDAPVETRPSRGTPAWSSPYHLSDTLRVPGKHPAFGSWSRIWDGSAFVDVRDYS
jgi:hypothetical protein